MLGAVGMLDVCAQYVVKWCGGISSQKHRGGEEENSRRPGWRTVSLLRDRWPEALDEI